MIPLRDNIPSRSFPFVNTALLMATTVAFIVQLAAGAHQDELIVKYGMIPAFVTGKVHSAESLESQIKLKIDTPIEDPRPEFLDQLPSIPPIFTLLSCVFLHGGWMHFLGNMLFLFIFGDNVEDSYGHIPYLLFYLGCGILASVSHLVTDPSSTVPTIGASGAIAGVVGAYFYLCPHAKVQALIPIFIFIQIVVLPAPLFLGFWFILQLLQGFAMAGSGVAGVAWWAHIGGFISGDLLSVLLIRVHQIREPVESRYPFTDRTFSRISRRF